MTQRIATNLEFIEVPVRHRHNQFCSAVAQGLSAPQKWLPCRFFYDTLGSQLFERICQLPEYYPTRTEQRILDRCASRIVETIGRRMALVEFGSGSSSKTRTIIRALLDYQGALHYVPIDISADFLRETAHNLLESFRSLSITAIAAEYNEAIGLLPSYSGPRLMLFLGSNIGNMDRDDAAAFLDSIRGCMEPWDRLLIGVDLLKDTSVIEAAYNDSQGVTAAFNKNLLVRANRELGADFDLASFRHHAPFVREHSRIEMRLVSRRCQTVTIAALNRAYPLKEGEYIHTENSYKYTLDSFARIAREAGLALQDYWTDEREWFAVILLRPRR